MGIAVKFNKGTDVVGINIDLAELHINKCQLGIFSYKPERHVVKAASSVARELEKAIQKALANDRLSCLAASPVLPPGTSPKNCKYH
jgi:hypothetical protein